ncbi:MAG: A/G-specific adenine glycosylase [Cytophagaceae bacterium SCN 52-12]|nr:MAG: A/G-specific adenine glycosylase [Cytophagaceae bacterium SCN 52-12]
MRADNFGHKLVAWYKQYHRKLPWRETRDPYRIWLSEIILQQTRVAQGYPYYEKFVAQYPDVRSLAAASEKEVLHLWQGLGYYSRARNMHATAKIICDEHGGRFPGSYQELLRLKGIGDYTASAIASFAFNEQASVVDGNVFRVLARYYGIYEDISSPASRKIFREAAAAAMPAGQAALFNQAIMEFGALQCVPVSPKCEVCPVNDSCYAYHHKKQNVLPVKIKKLKIKQRPIHYLVITAKGRIAMKERKDKDIWRGLYDFYSVEAESVGDWSGFLPEELSGLRPELSSGPFKHILTHQRLSISYWVSELPELRKLPEELQWYTPEQIKDLPKPLPVNIYLKDFFVTL